jgi:hypothetical protein
VRGRKLMQSILDTVAAPVTDGGHAPPPAPQAPPPAPQAPQAPSLTR